MELTDLPLAHLVEAAWNPNRMDAPTFAKLLESINRFGLAHNLVVRPLPGGFYEVLSGNQRLRALRELGFTAAPCVVAELTDARARLLAQALNRVQGVDDLGLKAELVRDVLAQLPQEEVVSILPDSAQGLADLATLGQTDMAAHLQQWQQAQAARLKHVTIQVSAGQLEVVEAAFARAAAGLKTAGAADAATGNPNPRGNALFAICKLYLERHSEEER